MDAGRVRSRDRVGEVQNKRQIIHGDSEAWEARHTQARNMGFCVVESSVKYF